MAVNLIYTQKGTPYIDQYKKTAEKLKSGLTSETTALGNARDAYRKQEEARYKNDVSETNSNYDSSGRQNYVNYMQAQKRLPSELNALGIRGGASESSLIRLGNTYGSNVATNESARGKALSGLLTNYRTNLNNYDVEYQKNVQDVKNDYRDKLVNAYATARQNQIQWEKEQQQKDLEYFSGAIEGLYGDTESYDKLIASLEKSTDPNREYKIMLARKAKQTLIDKLKEEAEAAAAYSSGGYGGGGGYSYDDGGGGYDAGAIATGVRDHVANVARTTANAVRSSGGSSGGSRYSKAANNVSRRFNWFTRG